jgi:hypothetical protein
VTWPQFWAAMNRVGLPVWTPNATVGFAVDHILAGALFGAVADNLGWNMTAAWSMSIAWTNVKEWIVDMVIERDSIWGSAGDSAGYLGGTGVYNLGRASGYGWAALVLLMLAEGCRIKQRIPT